uniref:Uncharacterized protein n=1 Tax=Vespula pensylvanica TaxID=30213 RepID=A0A834KSD1_VESPE|nr:hypothetical protein H0235_013618 [Vespula pensylvanica]
MFPTEGNRRPLRLGINDERTLVILLRSFWIRLREGAAATSLEGGRWWYPCCHAKRKDHFGIIDETFANRFP